jgi:hypothetical protein
MVDPVNLNVPRFDYLLFALLFFAVVALFTLVLARAELTLRRVRRARTTEQGSLLESRRVDGSLEWVHVRGQHVLERARDRRERQRPRNAPGDLIEEAED